jgi:hypothetical protein
MSLSLAKNWIQKSIGPPTARTAALRLFEEAAARQVDATLIVGPRLSANGKCYLARWDGWELTVLELGAVPQADWSVTSHGLYQKLHPSEMPLRKAPAELRVSLTGVQFAEPTQDGRMPLVGTCRYRLDNPQHGGIANGALRAQYLRPDLPRQVTAMWYVDAFLPSSGGSLRFSFPPLFSDKNPDHLHGALVLFLQLFTAKNWVTMSGCRKISNVTSAMVRLS